VRQSLKKYLRRKREALKPKVEAAKKCAGCSLEVFDEDTNTWKHMRVNRVEVKWLEGGAYRGVLCCWDSSPSHEVGGGLFLDFEAVRAQASRAASATRSSPSTTWSAWPGRRTGSISTSVATTFLKGSRPIRKLGKSGSTTRPRRRSRDTVSSTPST
jgi:hypothetical protein